MTRALHINNSSSSLRPVDAIGLPEPVETAARVVAVGHELRVLINRPGITATTQLRVLVTHQVEELPSLPLVSAGVAACENELLVTGADEVGRAVMVGVAADGNVAWQRQLDITSPARWPIPGCVANPVIVWQKTLDKLEVANCVRGELDGIRTINVGGPPLDVSIGERAVWAAWSAGSEIHCVEITDDEVQTVRIAAESPSGVAIGAYGEGAGVAWTDERGEYFARIDSGIVGPPVKLDLPNPGDWKLAVVSGNRPLVWATRGETVEGEDDMQWISALVIPGEAPLMIEGFVHAVAWWGDMVAVVGWNEIRFLESAKRTNE